MSLDRRRYEGLPPPRNWSRDDNLLRNLPASLKTEQYYPNPVQPSVESSRSRPEQVLTGVDLSANDYGRSNNLLIKKSKKLRGNSQFDYSRGVRADASLMPPIRQTASIFKQPVTIKRTQVEGKVKSDFKHGLNQDKPKQLFWEKRLEGLRACDLDGRELVSMELPRSLKSIGDHIGDETVLQSVATALHLSNQPVTGQTSSQTSMGKNPGVFINPEQPLVLALTIGDDDIKKQEDRVFLARKKLQEALAR